MSGTPLSMARSWIRLILLDWTRRRPAEDREVLCEGGHAPAVDLAEAGHDAVARVALVGKAELGLVVGGEGAHLLERAVVEEQREPLPGRELAPGVLLRDALGAAALQRPHAHRAEGLEMIRHRPIVAWPRLPAPRPDGPAVEPPGAPASRPDGPASRPWPRVSQRLAAAS